MKRRGIIEYCGGVDAPPSAAWAFQTNEVFTTTGDPMSAATLAELTGEGMEIDPDDYLGNGNAPGVLAFEAAQPISSYDSLELLVNIGDVTVFRCRLPMQIGSVDNMFRRKNLRHVCDGASSLDYWTGEPPNMPDSETNGKDLFFVHGFNVSEEAARNWSRQVFKRLWISGSRARFHGIAWYGDYNLAGSAFNGLHYHQDVYHALKTASSFKAYVESVQPQSSKRVLMAHSLGNMMTSEALKQGLQVGKYFLLNAAVASEAYDGMFQSANASTMSKYVPSDWNGYTNLCWAANWYKWFKNDSVDSRGKMGWPDYFSAALDNAGTVYNYYSSGDLVFMETETPPGLTAGLFHWPTLAWTWPVPSIDLNITEEAHSWQKQETRKGIDPIAGTLHGGWGFRYWEETVEGEIEIVSYSAAEANALVSSGIVTNNSVFSIEGTQLNNRNATQDDIWLSLAKHVPAVSSPVGGLDLGASSLPSYNLNDGQFRHGWGRHNDIYDEQWLHSDFKDMAFFYVNRSFDDIVTKGNLK